MSSDRRTSAQRWRGLALSLAAVAGAAAMWWVYPPLAYITFPLAVFLLVTNLFFPALDARIAWFWDKFIHVHAVALTWLLLGLVFALIFVPARVLLLLFRRDPLGRRKPMDDPSYWEPLAPVTERNAYKRLS